MMTIIGRKYKNFYRDSITLMRISNELSQNSFVNRAEILLATPTNIAALEKSNLFPLELKDATPNDVVVVVDAKNAKTALETLDMADILLMKGSAPHLKNKKIFFSIESAKKSLPDANLVLLSIPGPFVYKEAIKSIDNNLNLMIFSDNVPLDEEVEIKRYASEKGLLVMGPDCGTALINGHGLGFANDIKKGNIGIVAASGTGLQEVSCLLDRAGLGVSHGIGTGSNDIKSKVGGISLLAGVDLLESDPNTDVILIITKPPDKSVEEKLLIKISDCEKPVVSCFLGGDNVRYEKFNRLNASTLEEAASLAVQAIGKTFAINSINNEKIVEEAYKLSVDQRYIRGVFTGGTFVNESALILSKSLSVYTNTNLPQSKKLLDPFISVEHSCVDLGEDIFTQGKPHPMLYPLMRADRILQESKDAHVAVLLLDFVLGHGVHDDPVGMIVDTLKEARRIAENDGRYLPIFASVCGTESDPQIRSRQVHKLEEIGVLVFESNAQATRATIKLVDYLNERKK